VCGHRKWHTEQLKCEQRKDLSKECNPWLAGAPIRAFQKIPCRERRPELEADPLKRKVPLAENAELAMLQSMQYDSFGFRMKMSSPELWISAPCVQGTRTICVDSQGRSWVDFPLSGMARKICT